ncbi:MAG TPA: cytochrome c [Gammaproteobacteria bacterium]
MTMKPRSRQAAAPLLAGCLALALGAGLAHAGDPAAGRTQAQQCATCHGPLGMSINPGAPNLAGQPAVYLVEQLKAFRSGKRQHEVMSLIAKPLQDGEIVDLAAWYASLEVSVKAPQ